MPLFYRADVWRVGPGGWEHRTEWAGEQWRQWRFVGRGVAAGSLLPAGVQRWKTGRYGRQWRLAGDRVGGGDGGQVWEVAMRRGDGKAGCLVRGAGMEV